MSFTPTGIPFLDDLYTRWQAGSLGKDDALSHLASWELDPDRGDEELEHSYNLKNELLKTDPWVATQQHMASGHWEEARQDLAQMTPDHPRYDEIPRITPAAHHH